MTLIVSTELSKFGLYILNSISWWYFCGQSHSDLLPTWNLTVKLNLGHIWVIYLKSWRKCYLVYILIYFCNLITLCLLIIIISTTLKMILSNYFMGTHKGLFFSCVSWSIFKYNPLLIEGVQKSLPFSTPSTRKCL